MVILAWAKEVTWYGWIILVLLALALICVATGHLQMRGGQPRHPILEIR